LDAALLPHLAAHRVLDRLARLQEASQRAVETRRPPLLATQEHAAAVGRYHGGDHGRVRTGEADVGDADPGGAVASLVRSLRTVEVCRRAGALVSSVDG